MYTWEAIHWCLEDSRHLWRYKYFAVIAALQDIEWCGKATGRVEDEAYLASQKIEAYPRSFGYGLTSSQEKA